MNVLITGATGLVGSSVIPSLIDTGHTVTALVRSRVIPGIRCLSWDPSQGKLNGAELEGIHAVVHLAGESIVGRWTAGKKARIRESRVQGTRLLAKTVASMKTPPHVFVSASAIGYYGDRGEELLDEQSLPGRGFLTEVCKEWEAAARPASEAGIRTVFLRTGIVLSKKGGALAKMLPIFQLGAGGPLGNGRQWWSWIVLEDLAGIIQHVLLNEKISGPVNCVAPTPVTNAAFTKTLVRILHRPAFAPVPRFAARLLMGEMADALLFASARIVSRKLPASRFRFRFPDLGEALRYSLSEQQGRA